MSHPIRNTSATSAVMPALLIVIALWLLPRAWQHDAQIGSGWTLLLLALLLLLYRLRKALPFMRLAPVSSWRRVHIALGLLLPIMLLLHIGIGWPDASLERLLLLLLLLATGSGLVLTWQARRLPARLTAAGGNLLLDAIPDTRAALQSEARRLLLEVAGGPLQQRYGEMLAALLPGGHGQRAVLPKSPPQDLSVAQWREISGLIERSLQIDSQQRHQIGWRLLLTAHAGSSYVLLLLVLLHLLQAYRMLPQ